MAEREEWGAGGGEGRRVGGLEVGRAISEPSVAQWLTGGYTTYYRRPATTASASAVSGPAIVSTYNRHMPYSAGQVPARVTLN